MTISTLGTAIVTGASSGIGAVYADRLARRGFDIIGIGRNAERLAQVASDIRRDTGKRFEEWVADLSKPDDLARVESLFAGDTEVTLLINCAGVGSSAPFLDCDIDHLSRLLDLKVKAVVRLAHAAARAFADRDGGAIINVASIAGIGPDFIGAVYGSADAFILLFSQTLKIELAGKHIRIQVVLPGATATQFWASAGASLDYLPTEIVMSPEDLVDAAMLGFDRGELVTIPSLPDTSDWEAFEAARKKLIPNLSRKIPASRYRPTMVSR
jgi:short-subunit dehydrogenase